MVTASDRYLSAGLLKSYFGKFEEAVDFYSTGVSAGVADAHVFRHRGHRYLTLRRFEDAVRDLRRARDLLDYAPFELDVERKDVERFLLNETLTMASSVELRRTYNANAADKELLHGDTNSLNSSVHYHLGVAEYLCNRLPEALKAFRDATEHNVSIAGHVARLDWTYLTLRGLGQNAEADQFLSAIDTESIKVNSLEDYYLQRLRVYKGIRDGEDLLVANEGDELGFSTVGYGVAKAFEFSGQKDRAVALLRRITSDGYNSSFAYLAAEGELKRLNDGSRE
jgi:tetratricopeptide (TPR) repeat protein